MDSNPNSQRTSYVDLLTSQQGVFTIVEDSALQVPVFGTDASSYREESPAEQEERPPGVKAAKGKKKNNFEGKETVSQFQTMWEIKQEDLVKKERLSKIRILERLLSKKDGLDEFENVLKKKLIEELF
ncbi:hypothetical protein Bca52824_022171 [Brassica carinata]|uniref:Uncharacterized protein n=1 Tax=Brassica carinata TaxID=52824 RepID=A0A8X8AQZ8_BRACI|nr:hypothetical protein Bca52824_022171 [Brassica carinata]